MNNELLTIIEKGLFRLGDVQTIQNRIRSERDISLNYDLLSRASVSDESIRHIVAVFYDACKKNVRFQRKKSLIALKRLIKNRKSSEPLPTDVIDQLFYIFQLFVFDRNDIIQWAATTILKDQVLTTEQLSWLVANCDKTIHALNRLLRHPVVPPMLEEWARQCIEKKAHADRLSELLSLVINLKTDILALSLEHGSDPVSWGIYYARLESNVKQALLGKIPLGADTIQSYVEVCVRLGYFDLLRGRLVNA